MRSIRSLIGALALAACAIIPAAASADVVYPRLGYVPNETFEGATVISATYTNSTVVPSLITGIDLVIPATNRDFTKQVFTACWSADATKSTSTSGGIAVGLDGTPIQTSYRYTSSAAGRNGLSSCWTFVRPSANAFNIGLYGVSLDTALFTVNAAQMTVVMRQFN